MILYAMVAKRLFASMEDLNSKFSARNNDGTTTPLNGTSQIGKDGNGQTKDGDKRYGVFNYPNISKQQDYTIDLRKDLILI